LPFSVAVDSWLLFIVADAPMARSVKMRPDYGKASDRMWSRRFIAIRILRVINTLTVSLCLDRVMPE
jgi:hypothetical protein